MKKIRLVGIDIGSYYTKTARGIWRNNIRIVDHKTPEMETIEFGGKIYELNCKETGYNKYNYDDDFMYVQILAAVAYELKNTSFERIHLVLGLPFGIWKKESISLRDYVEKRDSKVDFIYNDRPYSLSIEACVVYTQGVSATLQHRRNMSGHCVTLGIGHKYASYLSFNDGEVDDKVSGTARYGLLTCYELVNKVMMDTYSCTIDYGVFEMYIHGHEESIAPEIKDTVDMALRTYCENLMRIACKAGFDPKTSALHVMGGGASLFEKYASIDEIADISFDRDLQSNAREYEYSSRESYISAGIEYYA